jgi:hypothetical protein
MLKQLEVFLITAVFVLVTAMILITYTMQRTQEFRTNQGNIQKSTVNGASYAIKLQLLNKHRHVQLFMNEYSRLLLHLNSYPKDEKTASDIKNRLLQRFPDFFAYTITDVNGIPSLTDIDSLVGDVCQLELSNFSNEIKNKNKQLQNKVVIHPQPFHYHYDIMAPLYTNGINGAGTRIFFASFYLKEIADILSTHEIPGQNLMLVKQSDPSLIEVTRKGARDKLTRNIHLSKDELQRINIHEDIPGTDWRLVNLPEGDFEKQYQRGLWKEAIIILLIVTLALVSLITVIIKRKISD